MLSLTALSHPAFQLITLQQVCSFHNYEILNQFEWVGHILIISDFELSIISILLIPK